MRYANATEREIHDRALDHACPTCGARASIRCRIVTPHATNAKRVKVDVRQRPCPERATLAWRAMLAAETTETTV